MKILNDKQKIKKLIEAVHLLVNSVPDGWAMPLGYSQAVSQAKYILEQVK